MIMHYEREEAHTMTSMCRRESAIVYLFLYQHVKAMTRGRSSLSDCIFTTGILYPAKANLGFMTLTYVAHAG